MNRSAVVTALAATVVLTVGGCGSNSKAPASTPSASTSQPAAGAPIQGCTLTPSEEMYVRQYYVCDSRSTAVYTFDSTDQRDNWWKVASQNGDVKDGEGDLWVEVKQ